MSLSTRRSFVKVALYQSGDFKVQHIGCRQPIQPRSDSEDEEADGEMKKERGIRGKIDSFSPQSSRRCLTAFRAAAHLFSVTILLTYPLEMLPDLTGPVSKEHLHRFIKWLSYNYGKDIAYAWVLEFMRNNMPHYHLLIDRFVPMDEAKKAWYDIVGFGEEKHFDQGVHVDWIRSKIGIADYVSRYLTKMDQKTVPPTFLEVGKFWGMKRGLVKPAAEFTLAYDDADSAFRALRPVRKARKASLRRFKTKTGKPIKWKWGGSGFIDRSMGFKMASRVLDSLDGELVDS